MRYSYQEAFLRSISSGMPQIGKYRRTFTLFLSVCIVLSMMVVPVSSAFATADGGVANMLVDDFSDERYTGGITYKWYEDNDLRWTINDGVYKSVPTGYHSSAFITANGSDARDYAQEWEDYTVETDFCHISDSTSTNLGNNKNTMTCLTARVKKQGSGYVYYELRANRNTLALFKVGTGRSGALVYATKKFNIGEWHNMKMELKGSIILCYLDGELLLTYDCADTQTGDVALGAGEPITSGTAGLHTYYYEAVAHYDNFKVTPIQGELPVFYDDFSDERYIGGVTYKWYEDNDQRWTLSNGVYESVPTGYHSSAFITANGSDARDYAQEWADYTVETDFCHISDSTSTNLGNNKNTMTCLTARVKKQGSGYVYYELRANRNTLALFKVGTGRSGALVYATKRFNIGEWHNMKMELKGSIILCYLDGELLLTYDCADTQTGDVALGAGEPITSGTAGLHTYYYEAVAHYDNFKVYPTGANLVQNFGKYVFDVNNLVELSSVWNFGSSDSSVQWLVDDNKLKYDSAGTIAFGTALLKNKASLTNYFVKTDVTINSGSSAGASLIGRCTGSTAKSYYQFDMNLTDGLTLSKTVGGTKEVLSSMNIIDAYLKGIMLTPGTTYTLKMQMYDNTINCYVNNIPLLTFVDQYPIANGTAGLMASGGTVSFDYLETGVADEKVLGSITIVNSDGSTVTPIMVNPGKVPDIKGLYLKLEYLNAEPIIIPLDMANVGSFESSTTGSKSTAVEYGGKTTTLDYIVIERADYIAQLNSDITAINVASLTASDKYLVYEISDRYDDLSYIEKTGITASNKAKLSTALEAIEFALYPELTGTQIVFKDEFDSVASEVYYSTEVSETGDRNSGYWYTENGALVQYSPDDTYRLGSYATTAIVKDKNWIINSVSADVKVIDPNVFLGIYACFNGGEFYQFLITDKTNVGGGNRIQLYKNDVLLGQLIQKDSTKWFQPGVWYNLKMVTENGLIKCYVDDVLVIECQDVPTIVNQEIYTSGTAGVRSTEGWGMFDNLVVRGTEISGGCPGTGGPGPILAGQYTDSFDDETADESPSHWIEKNTEDKWKVEADGVNLVYSNTDASTDLSHTWLHVFEQDVEYSVKLKVVEKGYFPQVGLTARFNADGSYIKAGYDFTLQKWFIKVRLGIDFDEVAVYASQTSAFNINEWYSMKLTAVGRDILLYVGDMNTPVVMADAGKKVMPGRVGVFTERCKTYIDDVGLTLLSGQGRVNDGVLEYNQDVKVNHKTLVELPDERLLMVCAGDYYVSTDNGQTFTANNEFTNLYATTIMRLHNGYYLHIKDNCKDAYLSTDGCKTWTKAGLLPLDEGFRYAQPQERINEVLLDDGTYRVFHTTGKTIGADGRAVISETYYTDDLGYTWHKSMTSPLYFSSLKYFCETQVIKIKNGPLIQYATYNNRGSMRYTLSNDNGVTWEGEYAIPKITCPLGSFCVKEDPYEPGTYYMSTIYNPPYSPGNGRPRHRIALLRSYDGLNWEYMADIDRWGDVSDGGRPEIMQNVNMSLAITKDYVFPLFTRSEQYRKDSSGHNIQLQRVYRFEKSKLRVYDSWPTEYYINPKTIVTIEAIPAQTKYLLDSTFTTNDSKIKVYYYDGTSEEVDMSNAFYTIPDMSTLGVKNVTVDYKYFRANFKIEVMEGLDMIFSHGNITMEGNSKIVGNTGINSVLADSINLSKAAVMEGNLFIGPGAEWTEVVQSAKSDYERNVKGAISNLSKVRVYSLPQFPSFPNLPDKGDIDAVGNSVYAISDSGFYNIINVKNALTINIGDQDVFIAAKSLNVTGNGSININKTGAGRLILYVEDQMQITGNGKVNDIGNYNDVIMYYSGNSEINLSGNVKFAGSVYSKDANITISGSAGITGHIISGGSMVNITGNGEANMKVIYAPNADLMLNGSGSITGVAVARSIRLSGNAQIIYDNSIVIDYLKLLN